MAKSTGDRKAGTATRRRPANTALHALASGALALPGLSNSALADAPAERPEASYRFSLYTEDDLSPSQVSSGSLSRYEIEAHQFHFGTPFGERMDLNFDLTYETLSGASPIALEDSGSGIQTVMSGATIEEERIDVSAGSSYYFDSGRAGASLGISDENDYFAVYMGLDGEKHVNNKSTTLLGGVSMSFDEIDSTVGAGNSNPHVKDDKQSYTVFAGAAQVLSKSAVLQATGTYRYSTGYLSDPYKQVSAGLISPRPVDSRPDTRHQIAVKLRARKHFDQVNGTLHGDFQYSYDTWGIQAGALELAWHQSLFEMLQLVPQFRYYTQSQADFYDTMLGGLVLPTHRSSDYRLSPYGAFSYGFKAQFQFRGLWKTDWETSLSYERYESDSDFALQKVSVGNPALVSSHLVSFRLTGRF